jgi:hypothetical protein
MGSLIPFTRSTKLALRRAHPLATTPRQLDLVLDDARLRGMAQEERRAALQSLAHLVLEAAGLATREASDDHE